MRSIPQGWAIVMVALGLMACSSPGVMSERQFTRLFQDSLQAAFPQGKFRMVKPLEVEGKVGELEGTQYLDNAYREYTAQPDHPGALISNYLHSARRLYEELQSEGLCRRESIMPVIRGSDFLHGISPEVSLVWLPYMGDFRIYLVEDTPQSMQYLTRGDLDRLPFPQDSLLAVALENLRQTLPPPEVTLQQGGYYMVSAGRNYETSLLLLAPFWEGLELELQGDPVVAVPVRDVLLITGTQNRVALEWMRKKATELFTQMSYPLTDELLRWDGQQFNKY